MKARLKPISDQVVVLFGATSGIGLDTALLMAEKGASLVLAGRGQDGLDQAVERVREHARSTHNTRRMNGGLNLEDTIIGIQADASDWEQVKNVADQAVSTFGRIDTWVQLASVSEWALFEDTSPDEFRQVIEINLVGSAYGAMAALPYMKQQQGGSIILLSSVAGRVPFPYQAAYNASKHGIMGMADTLRMELKHEGVPVSITTILPSSVNTPLFSKARTKLGVEPAPIPPVYDPRLVSASIVYATQHPTREIIVGGMGYTLQSVRRLSQPMANAFVQLTGFRMERSTQPKSPQQPDNLYHHIAGHNQVLGDYDPHTRKFSLYTWFSTHPAARLILFGALLGGSAFLGYRTIQARRKPSLWKRVRSQAKAIRKNLPDMQMPIVRMPDISMPHLGHETTMRDRVLQGYETAREILPGRRTRAWWENLPLLGLLPFLRKESRVDGAKKQVKHAAERLNKTVRNIPVRETVNTVKDAVRPERFERFMPEKRSPGKKEVYYDKRTEALPGGEKEVVYQKVEEKMPSGTKETIFERVEEKRQVRNR